MTTKEQYDARLKFLEGQYEAKLKYLDGIITRVVAALFFLSLWALLFIILVSWMFD